MRRVNTSVEFSKPIRILKTIVTYVRLDDSHFGLESPQLDSKNSRFCPKNSKFGLEDLQFYLEMLYFCCGSFHGIRSVKLLEQNIGYF